MTSNTEEGQEMYMRLEKLGKGAAADIREVHVFFGNRYTENFSAFIEEGCFREPLGRTEDFSRESYLLLCFDYELCFGSIKDPPYSNANFYAHRYDTAENARVRCEAQREGLAGIASSVPIYLWLHDNHANGLMNLLCFSAEFERFDTVFLVEWEHTEEDFDGAKFSMLKALEKRTRLTNQNIRGLSARFSEIQGLGAECLLGNSTLIEPWPLARVEDYVLGCMTRKYRYFGAIYLDVFDAVKRDTSFLIDYKMVIEAVHHLMLTGKIVSRDACMWWGDRQYNNVLDTQSFALAGRQRRCRTHTEAVNIVLDAFEFGYIYPLYALLTETATLSHEELPEEIVGREGIIEFIENDGVRRTSALRQKVLCDFGVFVCKEDNRTHKGAYLLLGYQDEELLEGFTVKILFDGNKVSRMEITRTEL